MRRRQGGFAKFAIHDARTLTKHPNISSAEAAASPCAAWTAYRALIDKLHIKKHGSILIYGATGGVGSYALQLCRHFQLSTIIAVCSEENFSYANGLGATHCFDYRDPMFFEKIKGFVGENGVDYALDCVGGSAQVICSSLLGFDGQLAELVSTIETRITSYNVCYTKLLRPFNKESGRMKGKRSIRGGRSRIRTIMFMAMMSSIQCNPIFKQKYEHLKAAGKLPKVALIASYNFV